MSSLRFARGQALSAAKDVIDPAPRSFAALRMTVPILFVKVHHHARGIFAIYSEADKNELVRTGVIHHAPWLVLRCSPQGVMNHARTNMLFTSKDRDLYIDRGKTCIRKKGLTTARGTIT
jgi:hypothetical protein